MPISALGELLCQLRTDGFRIFLVKCVDHQCAGNLPVAGRANFSSIAYRHTGGIERDQYFTTADRRVGG